MTATATPRSTVWARNNSARKRESQKKWVAANRERVLAAKRRYDAKNRERIRAKAKEYGATPEGQAQSRIRGFRRFGLTPEAYWELHGKQAGVCAVCRQPETLINSRTGETKLLAVDHDHVTGAVRGLLCRKCNVGIGLLGDSRERVECAARYLAGEV